MGTELFSKNRFQIINRIDYEPGKIHSAGTGFVLRLSVRTRINMKYNNPKQQENGFSNTHEQ